MTAITITYSAAVQVPAGWRQISITARAAKVSEKMATVQEVIAIDGEAPCYGMSRTGAKRQEFDGRYIARREVGARKRISSCEVAA